MFSWIQSLNTSPFPWLMHLSQMLEFIQGQMSGYSSPSGVVVLRPVLRGSYQQLYTYSSLFFFFQSVDDSGRFTISPEDTVGMVGWLILSNFLSLAKLLAAQL